MGRVFGFDRDGFVLTKTTFSWLDRQAGVSPRPALPLGRFLPDAMLNRVPTSLMLTDLTIGSNFCQVRLGNRVSAADGGGIQSEIWSQKYKRCFDPKPGGENLNGRRLEHHERSRHKAGRS